MTFLRRSKLPPLLGAIHGPPPRLYLRGAGDPELLAAPTLELTDTGYALTTFLDNAERYFPQLILGRLYGTPVYFE